MPANQTNPLVITLPSATVVTPAVSITTVTVDRIVDLPSQKIVRAFVREISRPLVLWEGEAYDAAGDWTQSQANAQILAKIQAGI